MQLILQEASLRIKEIKREPVPEPNPLIITIWIGSLTESILVQLFSKPQHTEAISMVIEPREKEKLFISSIERMMLEIVIIIIAAHSRLFIFSLKIAVQVFKVAVL